MDANQILLEMGEKLSLPELKFSEQGVVTFSFNDQYVTNIERSEDHLSLILYGVIGNLPIEDREKFLSDLLSANLWGHETFGATFSLDPDTSEIILFKSFTVRDIQIEEFVTQLQEFMSVQQKWSELILK